MKFRGIYSILLPFAVVALPLRGQDKPVRQSDIPAPVIAAFHKTFPAARIRGTSKEVERGKTYYEIESMDGTRARDILYLADGTAVEIEETVAAQSLPAAVRDAVTREFRGSDVTKAERTTKGTAISFEILVRRGAQRGSVVVDPAGKVLEKHALSTPKKKPAPAREEEHEKEED